jgi:DNA invertase Pin-like site-specific DNA recombinase
LRFCDADFGCIIAVIYGYARVSTGAQDLTSQLAELKAVGCEKIFRKNDRRPSAACAKLMKALAPDDVVTVTRIDRLARSTFDLFGIVKRIVDAKAQFRPLAEPWADTGTSTGRLMIAVLGGLADVERDLIPPVPPKAAAGRRSAGSIWADHRN